GYEPSEDLPIVRVRQRLDGPLLWQPPDPVDLLARGERTGRRPHLVVGHDLRAPEPIAVPDRTEHPSQRAAEARLLLDPTEGPGLIGLPLRELPLRHRPVAVFGPVDQQDLDAVATGRGPPDDAARGAHDLRHV